MIVRHDDYETRITLLESELNDLRSKVVREHIILYGCIAALAATVFILSLRFFVFA